MIGFLLYVKFRIQNKFPLSLVLNAKHCESCFESKLKKIIIELVKVTNSIIQDPADVYTV